MKSRGRKKEGGVGVGLGRWMVPSVKYGNLPLKCGNLRSSPRTQEIKMSGTEAGVTITALLGG